MTPFFQDMFQSTGFIFWFLCLVLLIDLVAGEGLTTGFLVLVLMSMVILNVDKVTLLLGKEPKA